MYIKKIMELGSGTNSLATEDVPDVNGDFDIDNLCGNMSFNLPYYINRPDSTEIQFNQSTTGVNTNELKKFDRCNLFYGEFKTDPGSIVQYGEDDYRAGGVKLTKIFTGFIDQIKLSKSKSSINYSITALGTLGMANYKNLAYEHKEGTAGTLIPTWLQISGLQIGEFNIPGQVPAYDYIPYSKMRFVDVDADNFLIVGNGGKALKEVLSGVREKYALIIHQGGDGYVNILFPFFLVRNYGNSSVTAWEFNINDGTLYDIDYGDLTQAYNGIVVLGQGGIKGVAVDVIALQNNGGVINYLTLEQRDLTSEEDCQKIAREKLLEMEKNYFISIKTKFDPRFEVGQPVSIIDNDKYDGTQIFFMKKYSFTISKSDVSCTIQASAAGQTLIPEDLIMASDGIADVDILEIRDKELDVNQWRNQ